MAAEHRSMIPTFPGVPSWGAVLVAVTFTAVGFAFDAGSGGKELTFAFAAAYAVGCVAAVVLVRQTAIFTAVIQPPLILFVSVPGAYFLFHGATIDGVKDLLINCGYPLIERFPLMFFTSAVVLFLGLLRWYSSVSRRRSAATAEPTVSEGPLSAITAKISGLLSRGAESDSTADDAAPRRSRQHSIDRSARTTKTAAASTRNRSGRPTKRTQPSRSRHTRPPETEIIEPVVERPRRQRTTRRTTDSATPPVEPRRRPRSSSSSHANPASNRRRVSAGLPINGPIGTAGSTASNPSNRTAPVAPTATAPITRSRGCVTAVQTTTTSGRNTGPGRGQPSIRPRPGSTTSSQTVLGTGRTDLAGQCEDQRLVGGRDRLHRVEAVLGKPLQHATDQDLGHRGA